MPTPAELARQAEHLDDEQWYQFLDELDEVTRRRRRHVPEPAPPAGSTRDEAAAWLARRHLLADSGVREIWYLPAEAPPDEIRFLELNDRLPGAPADLEAIDFGIDLEGAHFRLLVADLTSEQLDRIRRGLARLPAGWSLDRSMVWRRRA